jgi:hypothetical protein
MAGLLLLLAAGVAGAQAWRRHRAKGIDDEPMLDPYWTEGAYGQDEAGSVGAPRPPAGGFNGGGDAGSESSARGWLRLTPFGSCAPQAGGRGFKGRADADVGAWLNDDPTAGLLADTDNPLRTSTFSDF